MELSLEPPGILRLAGRVLPAPNAAAAYDGRLLWPQVQRMSLSVFDIFKIGIGPSSSHTMGPMNAARSFVVLLAARELLSSTTQVSAQLYGSLALTGRGHCTDRAILLGLEGMSPDTVDSSAIEPTLQRIRADKRLRLLGKREIDFDEPL